MANEMVDRVEIGAIAEEMAAFTKEIGKRAVRLSGVELFEYPRNFGGLPYYVETLIEKMNTSTFGRSNNLNDNNNSRMPIGILRVSKYFSY
jgi:hypothetical protein